MRCKDCEHYDVCVDYTNLKKSKFAQNFNEVENICDYFQKKHVYSLTNCVSKETLLACDDSVIDHIKKKMMVELAESFLRAGDIRFEVEVLDTYIRIKADVCLISNREGLNDGI